MRTQEEIEKEITNKEWTLSPILEVLLDIRELLASETITISGEQDINIHPQSNPLN